MIFIKVDEDERVTYTHFFPFDSLVGLGKTEAELLGLGYLVEMIPEPEVQEGKLAILCFNRGTKELFYAYEDIPSQPVDETAVQIAELKSNQAQILMALVAGGLM